jgi:hypothetical protein
VEVQDQRLEEGVDCRRLVGRTVVAEEESCCRTLAVECATVAHAAHRRDNPMT